ncbi:oocyte-secreted protein 3-like isoform X2 [Mesocricetus auratus]|uniref:Oocyte-secreted protein 3-like isoform X2 n=1 Tax=Mesocricetus auratus TaxID=10036 RepID=A0A3Q0CYS2_MESAU|nr:oocyte-secreted protein 3-like isoform X2 [Mesocricetus auratus]
MSSIMKAFVTSGLLLLLIAGMWRCFGQEPGTGCVVTYIRPHELEFYYPVSLCGTVIEIEPDRTVFNTWLTYKPRNLHISAELRLKCVVPSSYVVDDLQIPFPDQYWFLVQQRLCSSCNYAHLKDNWSTPFYKMRNHSTHFHRMRNQSFQNPFQPFF